MVMHHPATKDEISPRTRDYRSRHRPSPSTAGPRRRPRFGELVDCPRRRRRQIDPPDDARPAPQTGDGLQAGCRMINRLPLERCLFRLLLRPWKSSPPSSEKTIQALITVTLYIPGKRSLFSVERYHAAHGQLVRRSHVTIVVQRLPVLTDLQDAHSAHVHPISAPHVR